MPGLEKVLMSERVLSGILRTKVTLFWNVVLLSLLCMFPAHAVQDVKRIEEAEQYNGVRIYRLQFMNALHSKEMKLYAHHLPLRRKSGWEYAYVDFGYKLTNPVIVEEIPAGANELIGNTPFGERAFIGLSGSGYTEIRKTFQGEGRKVFWQEGDVFVVPYGYWVGHANPYSGPARLGTMGVTLTNDLIRDDLEMDGSRPKFPFVLRLLSHEGLDQSAGEINVPRSERGSSSNLEPSEKFPGFSVYQVPWGTPVNMKSVKTSASFHEMRAEAGWKSGHVELGGKILNWFIVQDIPAHSAEIGHRHGQDAVFIVLKGKGKTVFRDTETAPPTALNWEAGDIFCLPPRPGGVYHSHANESENEARFLASVNRLDGRQLLDPFVGEVNKDFRIRRSSDRNFSTGNSD